MLGSTARRRHTWLPKVLFVLGSFAAAGLVAAGVVSGADQPSISSDQSDYAPGDAVALSGGGWLAGEAVQVLVDDDQSNSWSHEAALTAGADGSVSDSFDLPHVAGAFSVTATAVSGTASASFTATALTPPSPPTAGTPTLDSDEEEYAPGATVTLGGADWQSGDTVHLSVDDDADDAWDHAADVNVAADGTITDTFDLPDGLAADFTATATDPANRTATATFETVSAGFGAATEPHLVRFASGTSTETQAQILTAAGAEDTSYIAPLRIHGVLLPGGVDLQPSIDRLRSYPSVTRVEPDRTREAGGTPNDSNYGDQWSLTKIGWENAFGTVSPSGSARVAILDTGIDGSHPDLDANVVPGTSILDGSNGLSDPNGHGTAMAGIVAAETDNGAGIAGVGYAGVQVMPVTVLDSDGTGQDSDIIEGVVYAADNGADVILMAFSNPGYSEMLQAAIDYAWDEGVVLVAATGNDGSSTVTFPAGDRGVIGVSNTDQNDALNSSSNHGQAVFLAAPGTGIATTNAGGGYTTVTGTSASAAEVAGAAALLRAASGASNGVIVSRLAKNAEAAGSQQQTGNGRLNLDRALADTSTAAIQPVGAAPVGGGGPFVGPYVAAARQVNINPAALSVTEGNVGLTPVSLSLTANGNGSGTIQYATVAVSATPGASCTPAVDFISQSGTITVPPAPATPVPSTIVIQVCGEFVFEPNETFTVVLQNPSPSTGSGVNVGNPPQSTVTIVNDDAANTAPTVAFDNPPTTANEGQTRTFNFTITDPDAGNTFTFATGFPTCGTGGSLVGDSASISSVTKTGTFQCSFANGPATPNVQVRVQDNSNEQSNTASQAVTVANVPPSIAISGAPSVNEGSSYSLTLGAVTDPGTDTVTSYVVHWGDGNTETFTSNGAKSHTYADGPATHSITVDLVDEDGTHLNRGNALSVTISNVAPLVTAPADQTANEGGSETFDLGSFTDPGDDDPWEVTVDWGDGSTDTVFNEAAPGAIADKAHTYADNGSFTVTVTVDEDAGAGVSGSATFQVTVANLPPVISNVSAESPIDEGDSSTVTVTASDPAGTNDPLSYEFDCDGNSVFEVGPQVSNSHNCPFADNGTFTVNVRVTDGDGGADTGSDTVLVQNVAPLVTAPVDQTANEGGSETFDLGSFTDPGDDDPWEVTVDWGDGSTDTVFNEAAPGAIADKAHTYADNGSFTVTVTVDEDAGAGVSGSATFQVTVANVPPVVTAPADQTANEGASATFALGSFTDPGDDDPWEVTVDWGDSSLDTTFNELAPGPIAAKAHTYADDGTFTVTVTVDEDAGAGVSGSATFKVTVANVPPVVTAPANQTANEGTAKLFDLGSFTDPGADSPWKVTVAWGDSSAATVFTEAVAGPITDKTHTYADNGTYTVSVTVAEETGTGPGSDSATFQVVVANVEPTVAKPTFQPVLIACQTMTTLTGISFSDPGVNDNPWAVDIDWGDASTHTTYTTATQGAQPNQSHTYSTPGPHTATVTVTDKDTGTGSNTSTAPVTVFQYTVDFLPPFDDSTPSGLIVNKMKNGRVVPVKARIRDECAGSIVTDPTHVVAIKVTKTSGSGAGDPIEEYADAGESSAGTNEFRPTGDHWLYNLDSKALGLVINNLYRVDVYVDGVKATVSNWAVLQPVK